MTSEQQGLPAERFTAFVDAAVAIALTLLILPLMDSVGDSAREGEDTAAWLAGNLDSLVSFVLSFVIIALFWSIHRALFVRVDRVDVALQRITFAWLLTIVWLPIATAITSLLIDDRVNEVLYVGSMIVTTLLILATRLYLRAHPGLHRYTREELVRGMPVDLSMATLFTVALIVMIVFPVTGYYPMFLLWLSPVGRYLFARLLRVPHTPTRGVTPD